MIAAAQSSFVGKGVPPPSPSDFDQMFVQIGRLACEAHYRAARPIVDAWLRERGKQRLIDQRAEFVKAKETERRQKLTRRDIAMVLSRAFPVEDYRTVAPELARRAADWLRIVRNGGFIISPTPHGDWWVGNRRRSAGELLDLAKERGFDPSLTGGGGAKVL